MRGGGDPAAGSVASIETFRSRVLPLALELTAAKLADGNVFALFNGSIDTRQPLLRVTHSFTMQYPMAGAAGRDLVLECAGTFKGDVTVRTAGFEEVGKKPRFTALDERTIKSPPDDPKSTIKVLIDTRPKGAFSLYFIALTTEGIADIERCTLDLLD